MTTALYIKAPHGERVCARLWPDSFIFLLLFYWGSADLGNLPLSAVPVCPLMQ